MREECFEAFSSSWTCMQARPLNQPADNSDSYNDSFVGKPIYLIPPASKMNTSDAAQWKAASPGNTVYWLYKKNFEQQHLSYSWETNTEHPPSVLKTVAAE